MRARLLSILVLGCTLCMASILSFGADLHTAGESSATGVSAEPASPGLSRKEELRALVPRLRIDRLLYLDPHERSPRGELLHGWQIVGTKFAPLPGNAEDVLMSRLVELLAPGSSHGSAVSYCAFMPRQALSLSDGVRTFDVLICFQCSEYEVYEDGAFWFGGGFSTYPAEEWKAGFETAGLAEPAWKVRSDEE